MAGTVIVHIMLSHLILKVIMSDRKAEILNDSSHLTQSMKFSTSRYSFYYMYRTCHDKGDDEHRVKELTTDTVIHYLLHGSVFLSIRQREHITRVCKT